MRTLSYIALLIAALQAEAATYYVRPGCANNGNGTTPDCATSGGGAGAYTAMSSITSSADGQVELAAGNTVYLIGTSTSAWNPGGVSGGSATAYFTLRCDHALGSGGFTVTSGNTIQFGGGSRNGLDVGPGCAFSGGGTGTNGIQAASSSGTNAGLKVHGNTFDGYTSAGVAIEPAQDATNSDILIYDNVFSNIGNNLGGTFTPVLMPWQASTSYALNDYRRPTTANGYAYKVTTAGVSSASEPSPWNTTVNGTTSDGTVVWTTVTPLGEGVRLAPARNASGTASGLVTGISIYNNTFTSTIYRGRYGISAYPCTTCNLAERATSGRVRLLKIYGNTFTGDFVFPAINLTNDVDGSDVYANSFNGTFGAAVIHVGGQGTYGTCNAATNDTIVRDHRTGMGSAVSGSVINSFNASDGAGIFIDECAVNTSVLRNEMAGNAVAGFYINDADTTTFMGNLLYGNGDNEIHIHGAGTAFLAYHNTSHHTPVASGVADQGTDGWQIDGSVGSGNVLINNIIVCSSTTPKCVDADVAPTESYNDFFGGAITVEGFTPAATDLYIDPQWFGGTAPSTAKGFRLMPTSPLLRAGKDLNTGTYQDAEGRGFMHPPSIGAYERASGDAR